ncbi:hypothetical protein ABK905_10350 [Acerihabitans sp. KWT182]|uniref:Uncharacterized protein n=1 Tax=Acerihabitans sp. KWT182 TaxID=3157919 RepID=A0AAU7QG47_9GAMM
MSFPKSFPPSIADSDAAITVSRDPLETLKQHFEQISRTFTGEESITLLHIGAGQTLVLTGDHHQYRALTLDLGSEKTASRFFSRRPPAPEEMENAIMAVEDEVLTVSPPDSAGIAPVFRRRGDLPHRPTVRRAGTRGDAVDAGCHGAHLRSVGGGGPGPSGILGKACPTTMLLPPRY